MSPSWTDRLRALGAPRYAAGIVCGGRHVGCALLASSPRGWRIETLAETPLAFELFRAPAAQEATGALAEALGRVCRGLRDRYLPVHVALPDAATAVAVFELEALPAAQAAQRDLVRWRLERESGRPDLACASQALGSDHGRSLLLGLGIERSWRDSIGAALQRAGIRPASLRGNALRLFNRYYAEIAAVAGGAALVALAPESWALLLTDSQGRPRFLRAWWRSGGERELDEIGEEVRRVVLAYAQGGSGRMVGRVFVCGAPEDDLDRLTATLDRQLREPCSRLSLPEFDGIKQAAALAPRTGALALAAAMDA